jgi:hypothetical protein
MWALTEKKYAGRLCYNILLNCALILLPLTICAQLSTSPYSHYGIGDLYRETFSQGFSMGNTSIGVRNPMFLNRQNPASYSAFDLTVFENGLDGNITNYQVDTFSQNTIYASFAYLGLGIPLIREKMGLSFGLTPFSTLGYNITNESQIENIGNVRRQFRGTGGINRAYIGTGVKLFKGFSAGINASFLFGSMVRESQVFFDPNIVPFNTRATNEITVSDFLFDAGLQYKTKLSEKISLGIGAIYSPNTNLRSTRGITLLNFSSLGANGNIKDTITNLSESGNIFLPQNLGAGISLEFGDRWLWAADVSTRQWSNFESFGRPDSLNNSLNISTGLQFVPDRASLRYLQLINYRIGGRYSESYLFINNTQIPEYGITFGAGFPLRRSRSMVNIGIELGRRGMLQNNLTKETYINASFGITVNDRWFIKRRFD